MEQQITSQQDSPDHDTIKIKGSCDRCALSKVKCDRKRPACGRCVTIGQELDVNWSCNYSISLRSLRKSHWARVRQEEEPFRKKPRGARLLASQAAAEASRVLESRSATPDEDQYILSTQSPSLGMVSTPAIASADCHSDVPFSLDSSSWFETGIDLTTEYAYNPDIRLGDPLTGMLCPDQLPLDDFLANISYSPGMTCDDFAMTSMLASTSSSSRDDSQTRPWSPDQLRPTYQAPAAEMMPSDHGDHSPSGTDNLCCTTRICETARDLCRATKGNACKTSQQDTVPSLDEALVLHKSSLVAMTSILGCQCSHRPGSGFALAYMLHASLCFLKSTIRDSLETGARVQTFGAKIKTPIRMGAYIMDAEDEQNFKTQLLRNELSKVSKLVDQFNGLDCNDECPVEGTATQSKFLRSCLALDLKSCTEALDIGVV